MLIKSLISTYTSLKGFISLFSRVFINSKGSVGIYGQKLRGHVSLISHPYGDLSACLLRHYDPYDPLVFTIIIQSIQQIVLTTPRCIPPVILTLISG